MITKLNHIELSDGDTNIVSCKICPLNAEEIKEQGNLVEIEDNLQVPCCNCHAYLSTPTTVVCSYYFGVVYTDEKGFQIDCRHVDMEERENLIKEENNENQY